MVLCVCRRQLWERYRTFFAESPKTIESSPDDLPPKSEKRYSNRYFSSYSWVVHVECSFVKHADLLTPNGPALFMDVRNYLKHLIFSGTNTTSNWFSLYVVGFVNSTVENFPPKSGKLSLKFSEELNNKRFLSPKICLQKIRLVHKNVVRTSVFKLWFASEIVFLMQKVQKWKILKTVKKPFSNCSSGHVENTFDDLVRKLGPKFGKTLIEGQKSGQMGTKNWYPSKDFFSSNCSSGHPGWSFNKHANAIVICQKLEVFLAKSEVFTN